MTTIQTNIEWQNSKYGNIIKDGQISLSEDGITVSVELTSKEMQLFSSAHPACIDVHADLARNIIYRDSEINGKNIDVDISKAYVPHFTSQFNNKHNTISWTLSELTYTYSSEHHLEYRIINAPFIHLLAKLGELAWELKSYTDISFEGCKYRISPVENPDFSKLVVLEGTPNVSGLLSVLSLYTKCPINIICEAKIIGGKQRVHLRPTTLQMNKEGLQNYELAYINAGKTNRLTDFLEKSHWNDKNDGEKSTIQRAIYTFASSKYLSLHLQFLTIFSILDKYVGNSCGKDPYNPMREKLLTYGIDINKIGVENDGEILSLRLTLEHDNGKDKKVRNFIDLRNFILHFMTTPEIDDYLEKGVLVGKMRFAAFIILVQELGIEDVSFKEDWKHLSILTKDK